MEENNEIQLLALIAKQPGNQQISGKKRGRGFFFRKWKREHFLFLTLKILKYKWLKVYGVFSKYFPDIFNGFWSGGSVYWIFRSHTKHSQNIIYLMMNINYCSAYWAQQCLLEMVVQIEFFSDYFRSPIAIFSKYLIINVKYCSTYWTQ